ncbi:MAG: sugar phosphate isomerase/epimerase [Verrucomicrobia bacterium]|nr:sugar phosphate isomerase/epimerase [Verrucomicrobiota bacterium]
MNTDHPISRRHFLHATAGLALAAGNLCHGAEKRRRLAVACRDVLLKTTGKPTCWAAMKELGVSCLEVDITPDLLCPSLIHPDRKYSLADPDSVKQLADDLAANRATITAFCMHNKFDEKLDEEIAWMRKLLPAAQQLKVKVIRIDVVPRKTPIDQFLPVAIKACKAICEIAEGKPVRYGIENHGRFTNDPDVLEKLFAGVGSPQLGLTLDALNLYWFGHPLESLYGIIEKFAPRVVHTHCKSVRYPEDQRNVRRAIGWEYAKYSAPIYDGDIDYKRVVAILRKAGYQADLCLENECLKHFPPEQHAAVIKKELAMLKTLA